MFLSFLPFLKAVVPDGQLGGPDNVVVGEHHALGVASGSAGVDQGGALVDGDASQPGLERRVVQTVSSVHNVLPADNPGRVRNAGVLNNFLQVGKITLETPDLVQLPLVLHNEDVALAVLQDILASLGSIGGVDSCGKSSSKNSGQVRDDPLRGVEPENADRAKSLQAEIDEGLGDSSGVLVVSRPTPDRLKREIILFSEQNIIERNNVNVAILSRALVLVSECHDPGLWYGCRLVCDVRVPSQYQGSGGWGWAPLVSTISLSRASLIS